MPLYEYACRKCGERVEVIQKMNDAPPAHCLKCGGDMKKMASSPAIQFKGSGFYKTDYASASSRSDSSGESKTETKAESKSETKGEAKNESKGETKSESKTETRTESKTDAKTETKTESKSETKPGG